MTEKLFKNKKILIIHYRVGQLDGVSLEITNWEQILIKQGAKVVKCAGPVSVDANYIINDLEQQLNLEVFNLEENSFGGLKDYTENEFLEKFEEKRQTLSNKFNSVLQKSKPDIVLISNMYSVGENLPAAVALLHVLDQRKPNTIVVNHDFWWENPRYEEPSIPFVRNILDNYLTPKRDYIRHCTINSIAQKELLKRKGIRSIILHDTLDFNQRSWVKTPSVKEYLQNERGILDEDIIILQATRVVRRKNIEIAIDFVKSLTKGNSINKIDNKLLYDGGLFDKKKGKIAFVISGYAEKRDNYYLNLLMDYAKKSEVNIFYIGDVVGSKTAKTFNRIKFSLDEIYPFADLITYPSEYEGFGNQFVEAVFAKKPVVVYEYPVFKTDIKPKGFKYISLGDEINKFAKGDLSAIPKKNIARAVAEAVNVLTDSIKYNEIINDNFELGKKYFSFEATLKTFNELING